MGREVREGPIYSQLHRVATTTSTSAFRNKYAFKHTQSLTVSLQIINNDASKTLYDSICVPLYTQESYLL